VLENYYANVDPQNGSGVMLLFSTHCKSVNHKLINNKFIKNKIGFIYHDYVNGDILTDEEWTNINNPQFTGAHRCSTNNTLE